MNCTLGSKRSNLFVLIWSDITRSVFSGGEHPGERFVASFFGKNNSNLRPGDLGPILDASSDTESLVLPCKKRYTYLSMS